MPSSGDITKYNELATAEEAAEDCHAHEAVPPNISLSSAAGDWLETSPRRRLPQAALRPLGRNVAGVLWLLPWPLDVRVLRQAVGSLCRLWSLGLRRYQKAEVIVASVGGLRGMSFGKAAMLNARVRGWDFASSS